MSSFIKRMLISVLQMIIDDIREGWYMEMKEINEQELKRNRLNRML